MIKTYVSCATFQKIYSQFTDKDTLDGVNLVLQAAGDGEDLSQLPDSYSYFAYAYWLGTVREEPEDLDEELFDWSSGEARSVHEDSDVEMGD